MRSGSGRGRLLDGGGAAPSERWDWPPGRRYARTVPTAGGRGGGGWVWDCRSARREVAWEWPGRGWARAAVAAAAAGGGERGVGLPLPGGGGGGRVRAAPHRAGGHGASLGPDR